ncbi:MAG: hypothetical protein HY072_07400 [Deltaproteobacteria bacterium]|nr:hypothetical protein [Deltaproteobacteria bacterium]
MQNTRPWIIFFPLCTFLLFFSCSDQRSATTPCILSFTSETSAMELGINNKDANLGGDELAQSFKLSEDKSISNVLLKLQLIGFTTTSPIGYKIALKIESNSAGAPSGTEVTNADSYIDLTQMNTAAAFYAFSFSSAVSLTKDTAYWIRIRGTYPSSKDNFVKWIAYNGDSGYSNGQALYETAISNNWSSQNIGDLRDFVFQLGCN